MTDAEIAAFVKERNEMLLGLDRKTACDFYAKYNPGLHVPPWEVFEISLHKARTAALGLPLEARELSKAWLTERGYAHLGDEP